MALQLPAEAGQCQLRLKVGVEAAAAGLSDRDALLGGVGSGREASVRTELREHPS
jgi:hypothetical protein